MTIYNNQNHLTGYLHKLSTYERLTNRLFSRHGVYLSLN